MADKKLRRCTGSSLNLRTQMDQNYVIVHDVSSNVSFEKYIQFARGCFDQAIKLYNKKDYQRAYVDFTKFHQFSIPPPTVARHSIYVGNHAHHFEQHDFHLSFAPFLRTLPPELHMSRAAVEVNRCFFIHLGVATQLHPYALQSYFRHTAAAERSIEADWQVELAKSIGEYAGLIDANVLQYTWPENFDKYRILLISGPAEDPLLTCFVPQNRNRSVEDLYEIVIRNDRSHFTLLRPLANLTTKIKIIDTMLRDAEQARCVHQVCPVISKPNRNVGAVIEKV
eukprot:gene7679-9185_t